MATEEERMSVSAALQRFREIEKLTAEARALEEQQLALLEAQRITSLHNRVSNPPPTASSPTSVKEQQQQSSSSFRAADAIEDVGVPFGVAHQRAQELEKYPSGREGSDEDGSRSPGVVRRSSKGKELGSPRTSCSRSSAGSSEKSPRLVTSTGASPSSSSVSTPRSTKGDSIKAAAAADAGVMAAQISPSALASVEEAPAPAEEAGGRDEVLPGPPEEPAEAAALPSPTPPESPMSPPREISPVSAKILAAEAGRMHNAKTTYKTPAPVLGAGFGAFDYEPPAPEDRPAGPVAAPAVVTAQDSPRPGSVRQLSATFGAAASLSRSASNTSEELRARGFPFRALSADGSETLNDVADAAAARGNRRSSLGAAPLVAEMQEEPQADDDDGADDGDDFGTFEEAGDAAPAGSASAEDTAAGDDYDGFGTFEEAELPAAAEPSAATTVAESGEEGFADFEEASGGDDDGFGDFDAAPAAPISEPAPAPAAAPAIDLLSLPADKFEEAARVTLGALAGYGINLEGGGPAAPAGDHAAQEVAQFGEMQRAAAARWPEGSVLRCGGFVLPATRQPVQALRWRESQAEARLLSHFGLLWVAREAAATEKQRVAEAAARRRRPSSSSIGSGASIAETPQRSPSMALPDAAPPGVDSLFAGYAGPAGTAAASPAPSSGRVSPDVGAAGPALGTLAEAAPNATAEAELEQPVMGQSTGSSSAADLQSLDAAAAGLGSLAGGASGDAAAAAGPSATPPRPRATPKKTPVFATLSGSAAPKQKRRLSTFGIAGAGAPAPRSSSPTIPDSEAAAPGTAATSPPPFPPPMLAVPIVPPPPKGAARDAAGLAGAGPRSGSLAEPATVADPFAFSGAADLLSAYSVNGGAAFGSYTEMPGDLHKEADEDFDGFVGGDFDAFKNGDAADVTRIRQPTTISATLTGSDPADGTEAVLNSLPDLRFMLDRGRTWPMHGVTVV